MSVHSPNPDPPSHGDARQRLGELLLERTGLDAASLERALKLQAESLRIAKRSSSVRMMTLVLAASAVRVTRALL